ncbi:MAG: GNAT family protein [Planctomycetota bacterium]
MQPQQKIGSAPARAKPLAPASPVKVDAVTPDSPREILTPRLRLRPLSANDRDAFCALYDASRDHLEAFLPLGGDAQTTRDIFERQLEMTSAGDSSGKAFRRIAVEIQTGRIVGAFNLVVIRRGLEWDADTSCWLAAGNTGDGLASEGLSALLSYSFADLPEGLGLHAIHSFIAPENHASKRLAQSFGFAQDNAGTTHLTVGDRWQVHEKWTLSIARWQTLAS